MKPKPKDYGKFYRTNFTDVIIMCLSRQRVLHVLSFRLQKEELLNCIIPVTRGFDTLKDLFQTPVVKIRKIFSRSLSEL